MPLTISHPIAIVPIWYFSNKKLDLLALIVGTMIPDVSYFLHLKPIGNIGHSVWGMFVQGIPVSLVLLLLFSNVMLLPLRSLSPFVLGKLLPEEYSMRGTKRLLVVLLSISIGASTHILWDGFTHKGAYFVDLWPTLSDLVFGLPIYKLLQYGSGIFGLLAIALVVKFFLGNARSYEGASLSPKAALSAWCLILLAIVLTTFLAYASVPSLSIYVLIVQSAVGVIAGSWIGILTYSIAFNIGIFSAQKGTG